MQCKKIIVMEKRMNERRKIRKNSLDQKCRYVVKLKNTMIDIKKNMNLKN